MDRALEGKIALVTGASRGIGAAIASTFAAAGAGVMISARKQESLDATAAEIRASHRGAVVETFAANAGEPDQAEACVDTTMERLGAVDILVNNAAANPVFGPLIDVDLGVWDKVQQVNLRGPFVWSRLVWRAWMERHGGVIVNMASLGGVQHLRGLGAYDVSKAGLIHLTKVLAAELGPGVRVNALAPGVVKTEFARVLWEGKEDRVRTAYPLGRLGEPQDVANGALFLASDASSWMSGQTLVLDGGRIIAAG